MYQYVSISINIYHYVQICMNMYQYLWICINVYQYVQICMNMYEYVWICMNMHQNESACINMYEYVWICTNMYKYIWICIKRYQYVSIVALWHWTYGHIQSVLTSRQKFDNVLQNFNWHAAFGYTIRVRVIKTSWNIWI